MISKGSAIIVPILLLISQLSVKSQVQNPTQNPFPNPIQNPTQNPIQNPTQNPIQNPTQNPTQTPIPNITFSQILFTLNATPYQLVSLELVTPEWEDVDAFDVSRITNRIDKIYIRHPHPEVFYQITYTNQQLVILHTEQHKMLPNCSTMLTVNKTPRRFFSFQANSPFISFSLNARHMIAEYLDLRRRNFGSSHEMIAPFLYLPTGWPVMIAIIYAITVFTVPFLGSFLVHAGFFVAEIFYTVIWHPIKLVLRAIFISWENGSRRWQTFLAPEHYLEHRHTWKLPGLLRNDPLEDTPPELSHKPPTNKIDYTMYILTQEDYDELDLGMDELEYVDEMLQFSQRYPKAVTRLLKQRLGIDKFYYYFDEEFGSDDDDDDDEVDVNDKGEKKASDELDMFDFFEEDDEALYQMVLETDEPWMHDDFDKTYTGYDLEEIKQRRTALKNLRDEIIYLHEKTATSTKYNEDMTEMSEDKRRKLQEKARKLIERYLRYSLKTKERFPHLEPSKTVQQKHNLAFNKYLPLIEEMSHINHRLNTRHDKQTDPRRRKLQLNVFHWP